LVQTGNSYISKSQLLHQQQFSAGELLAKKKGERYKCDECGLVVLVEDICGCEDCDVICCGAPMKQFKEKSASKAKPKPKAKAAKPKK
jgi:hypothetical protein